MTIELTIGRIVHGYVKWFDPVKGFGFVVCEDDGPDILLHANVLRNFGQSSISEGAEVEIEIHDTSRGVQATQVFAIKPPPKLDVPGVEDSVSVEAEVGPLLPARIKWFDRAKGFGFANVFGYPEDVFVHVEVLRLAGLADLQPGEAVAIRVVDGERGQMAASVTSWEAVLSSDLEP